MGVWTEPDTLSALFDTGDIPTQGNFDSLLTNFESIMHPLESPTTGDLDVTGSGSAGAETTFYSLTVPANSLGTTGSILLETLGDIKGTAGGSHICTTRIKFGGTTHITSTCDIVNVTSYVACPIVVKLANRGATNAQVISLMTRMGAAGGTQLAELAPATAAIDTTSAQTLLVSVQWANTAATNSVRRRWARTLIGQN